MRISKHKFRTVAASGRGQKRKAQRDFSDLSDAVSSVKG